MPLPTTTTQTTTIDARLQTSLHAALAHYRHAIRASLALNLSLLPQPAAPATPATPTTIPLFYRPLQAEDDGPSATT
ncbi:hypothetical protein PTTG_03832 [Puccinia triticina 1-1 BBBD Race 1]|uniref:Uncharacterized protein n=1 Tax=Puccinia triticina (isolate 1-1 / race 1 (BBBD)) TaxID=630390 RepID=A0A0C4ESQ3_PUCT1|nr:hypothetical protein PTTG_03832 [Puccinia triticina 1-1 BBBD Race 1]